MEYVQLKGYFVSQFGAGSRAGLGFSVPISKAPTLSSREKESIYLQPIKDQVSKYMSLSRAFVVHVNNRDIQMTNTGKGRMIQLY